ncbi:MAG: hypothetical protein C4575_00550 [Desulforudis sp.]|nr:MAG: hypothetical protein C4575_00550 [Desulforudis sp.]
MATMSWALVVQDEPGFPVLLAIFETKEEAREYATGMGCMELDGGDGFLGVDGRVLSVRLARFAQELDLDEPGIFGLSAGRGECSPSEGRLHLGGLTRGEWSN